MRVNENLNFNQWIHFALVRDAETELFYINGQPITESTGKSYTKNNFTIGKPSDGDAENPLSLNGNLQEFRILKKAIYSKCFKLPNKLRKICNKPSPLQHLHQHNLVVTY